MAELEAEFWKRANDLEDKLRDKVDVEQLQTIHAMLKRLKEKEDTDEKQSQQITALQKQLVANQTLTVQLTNLVKASGWLISWRFLVILLLLFTSCTSVHYWWSSSESRPWSQEELKQMIRQETDISPKGGK